ncbi:translocation/assembly module TamB domain-containing protein [Polaromonas sp. SM01]|uniref:translocation/assembly module TamB domain-containing protein n=1 Tax=Polaromonas sp. SM01 TaxID=3085630 RepID=UPI002981FA4B|nr:translocation/assembly module TamB domain-containing protein [Polaromonas sp. SM01]MDW5442174.1 translocation/assembly module TamB domain-containing protein [Polaromonas sp. SM01]
MKKPPPLATTRASDPPRRPRWRRAILAVLGTVVLVPAGLLGAAWWWSGTEGSLATALAWAARSQPLVVEQVSGALRTGGRVGRLHWQDTAGLRVTATDVVLAWHARSLLSGRLTLARFSAALLRIDDQRPATAPSGPPPSLRLPLPITLDTFSADRIEWVGPPAVEVIGLRGRYAYSGSEHQLDLANVQVAGGRYQGRVRIASSGDMAVDAQLSGALEADVPGSTTRLPLALEATAKGPLAELQVAAALRIDGAAAPGLRPEAQATARVMPWAVQPLPEAQATFRDLNAAMFWPDAPRTQLTGNASVKPGSTDTWQITAALRNALPGPWDQQQLPLAQLQASGEWRGSQVLLQSLDAQLGGGRLQASGQWMAGTSSATAASGWKVDANFQGINAAALHTQLAPQAVTGTAAASSNGDAIIFDTKLQAAADTRPQNKPLAQLRLRDLLARGTWHPRQAGGTLDLAALQLRTTDAELNASGQFQPKAQGGKGQLKFTAPGLQASVQGELHPTRGAGQLTLQAGDANQALRWLRTLPGLGAMLKTADTQGQGDVRVDWQGGWKDPQLNAKLTLPSLDWANTAAGSTPAPALKLRAVQASLNGRLSQAQLALQGRAESGTRRFGLSLAAEGGAAGAARNSPWSVTAWQALVKQLKLSVEDPALGAGAWRIESQRDFTLRASAATFEAGAGQALLIAPTSAGSAAPSQAVLAWQPARWRPGEITTAGTLKGLPLAWIELLAGPQLAGAGLAGNLVFDGEWDALIGPTLRLNAVLARSSGDLTVQAEDGQGTASRVAAGIRDARLTLRSEGEAVTLALRWDSERAGNAEGQLRTRLQRAAPPTAKAPPGQGGWTWPADAPLNGQLRAQLPRIGAWSVLAPPGWRLRGSLGTSLTFSGTRSAPHLAGELRADDLALRSVVDGIEFGNGRLRATLDGTRMRISEFTLQGAGDKGTGGLLTAQGEAGWVNGKPLVTLSARLDKLRASIRTDRQLTASGQLQTRLNDQLMEVTGALRVDQARILLPDEGRPELGSDVLVRNVGGAALGKQAPAQAAPTAEARPDPRKVRIAVDLDLGNDFRIEGKGLDTRVRGTLALSGESLTAPRLVGTVRTVGGQYRAYGQRLDVEQGVLRFTGPIDNPALDILAVRPNMTQRVGVQIIGTALLPTVRLYAQPEMSDSEKLSWLVLGHAGASGGAEAALLQQAALALLGSKSGSPSGGLASAFGLDELSFGSGENSASGGAITLGKRFSRNFYAAYERSLSGAFGTLFVFYDLSKRFTVRAQAGDQAAVDLIYTFSYD